ncbi:voltage-gated potassium channel protein [Burkholderia ubonensis]|uniref:Voltage-gated potassium channel TrkA n=1 Tax=Burkholderia ubonensis TaxID=101571 RepID=A0AAW3NA63_9BURK|nr:voltage-gated potassium channel protein [Burkholderia ubonensis]KVT51908.1 voltage-gated potassium channel TrkA [Burkholderia ubonensis]
MKRITNFWQRVFSQIGPQWYLATLLVVDGLLVLYPVIQRVDLRSHGNWADYLLWLLDTSSLLILPQVIVAVGLATIAIGIVLRARVAWVLSLLLLGSAATMSIFGVHRSESVFGFTITLLAALIYYWRRFDRASVAASSLFAFLSIFSLLIYAVFGVLYLGAEFSPPIHDLATAAYFSIVSMSTVGYGDIVPHTTDARLFTVSIIVLGITVFATSISAIVGPVIGGNLKRIVKGGISNVIRKNHFLIVGASPIAHSVYDGLRKRGYSVTVLIPPGVPNNYPEDADLVTGDPSDTAALERAGANGARAVLALRADDAENAFTVLAIRDFALRIHTVALVNDHRNLQRLRLLKPDMVFSPQQLAGELLARTLNGETIDNALVSHLLFGVTD